MRRRGNKDNIRSIQKTKDSYYITIPMDLVKELGWRERQKVKVQKISGKRIVVKDWKRR